MTEPTLFPVPPASPVGLTDRQATAYAALVRAGDDGMSGDEIGAVLHAAAGHHHIDGRCQWCSTSGLEVLRALRRKGLVRSRRHGLWTALAEGGRDAPTTSGDHGRPPSANVGPGDFPEGF